MLPFVQLNLILVLLLSRALVAVEPFSIGRRNGLCPHTALDEDYSFNDVRYRGILIENEPRLRGNEKSLYTPDDTDHNAGPYDGQSEDRSGLEWKKVRRYIKRQLKVPRRYLKKIVRKLTVASNLRSNDGEDVPTDTNAMNIVLARANGHFDSKRLVVVDNPEPVKVFLAVVAATGDYP